MTARCAVVVVGVMKLNLKLPAIVPPTPSDMSHKHIEILRTLYLRGPSIWTYRPIIEALIDIGELEDFPSNTLPGFNERIAAWLPGSEGEVTHTAGFSNTLRQYLVGWEYAPNSEGQRLAIQASLDDETPEFHWTKADPIGLTSGHDTTEISTRSIRSQGQVYWDVAWKSGTREWRLSSLVSGGQENLEPSGTISDNPSWNNRRRNVLGAADISFQPDTSWTITVGGQGQIVSDYTEGGIAYYGAAVPPTDKTE